MKETPRDLWKSSKRIITREHEERKMIRDIASGKDDWI